MNKIYYLLAIMLLSAQATMAGRDSTLQQKNEALIVRMNTLFNEGKNNEATRFFADSLVNKGNDKVKSFFVAMQDDITNTFPDVKTTIVSTWTNGDWVISYCKFSGTHKGVARLPHHGGLLVGLPPTNKSFTVDHIRMYKIIDGKIVERKAVRDDVSMYQQLGIIAPPGKPVF